MANRVATLLVPRTVPLRRLLGRPPAGARRWRALLLGLLGGGFWLGVFAVSWRMLRYFRGIEGIGDILGYKLLSMLLIVCFALLLFSGILTVLSKLYLSRDLALVHAMPVPAHQIFLARLADSTVDSSWMVSAFTVPVLLAFGIVYRAGPLYYLAAAQALLALASMAAVISALLVPAAVMAVPASRMRSVVVFLGILLFAAVYVAIRLLRPEQLVDPQVFETVMVYVASLEAPTSPLLPTTWVYDALRAALDGRAGAVAFHAALCWSFAAAGLCAALLLADAIYFRGYSKTQAAAQRIFRPRRRPQPALGFLPGPLRAWALKEIKTFWRDQMQWSQLFLIAALVVIYLYNFSVLPLEKSPIATVYLQNVFAFLNMGLALFVLTAVSARFAYPAVSQEKSAIWLVQCSPISLPAFLWVKFWVYYLPLLVLTELLVVATNLLLEVTPLMMALSTLTVFCLVPGIVSLGIGLGAAFPDFKAENPAQTVTSYGGLVYMMLSTALIAAAILLEAGPVYRLFMAAYEGRPLGAWQWAWAAAAFTAVLALAGVALLAPMRFGARRLEQRLSGRPPAP